MLKILVTGAAGKMGRMVVKTVKEDPDSSLAAATESGMNPFLGQDAGDLAGVGRLEVPLESDIDKSAAACDCIIDFSSVEAFSAHLNAAVKHNKAIVIGTTGLTEKQLELVRDAGKKIPVIWAPNFSVGVTLITKLTRIAAEILKGGFDAEIVETHHRLKKDAPSGTALKLLDAVKKVYQTENIITGRNGITGERPAGQIGVFAVRGGDVVGDHTVSFLGLGERVEITHKATSRETFARGALRAAKHIVKSGPGLYTMEQVLGL